MFKTPDITLAQLVGMIPIVATLLTVFGVYHLSPEQVDALKAAVAGGGALIVGDGIIRHGRATGNAKKT